MRISDWSSDVCSSDLDDGVFPQFINRGRHAMGLNIVLMGVQSDADFADLFGQQRPLRRADHADRDVRLALQQVFAARSEERRVGKACVSTCRSRWSPSN